MNSMDTSAVRSTMIELLRMPSTQIMPIAMVVEYANQHPSFKRELESVLQTQQSSERLLGQDITGSGKMITTSKRGSTTGIELLCTVLEALAKSGSFSGVLVSTTFNDSGSDIQGITLSFPSTTKQDSLGTSGEPIPYIPILPNFDIRTPTDNPRLSIGLSHRTDPL